MIRLNDLAKKTRPIFSNPNVVSYFEELNYQENISFFQLRWNGGALTEGFAMIHSKSACSNESLTGYRGKIYLFKAKCSQVQVV